MNDRWSRRLGAGLFLSSLSLPALELVPAINLGYTITLLIGPIACFAASVTAAKL